MTNGGRSAISRVWWNGRNACSCRSWRSTDSRCAAGLTQPTDSVGGRVRRRARIATSYTFCAAGARIVQAAALSSIPGKIVIATRESALAIWQAQYIRERLLRQYPDLQVELLGMITQGDRLLSASLAKVGGKGLFVKELERALAEERADIAVHSMKDVPMDLPAGFTLAAVAEREDPR